MNGYREFGRIIRERRKAMGLSQKRASEIIGIGIRQYGYYDRGELQAPMRSIGKLARFYKIDLNEFFEVKL